jgi:hypothetical protein
LQLHGGHRGMEWSGRNAGFLWEPSARLLLKIFRAGVYTL